MVLLFIVLRATSFIGIMRNYFKHAPFSFDRLWQFRGQKSKDGSAISSQTGT